MLEYAGQGRGVGGLGDGLGDGRSLRQHGGFEVLKVLVLLLLLLLLRLLVKLKLWLCVLLSVEVLWRRG